MQCCNFRVGSDSSVSSPLDAYGAWEAPVTRSANTTTIPPDLPDTTITHTIQAATMDAVTPIREEKRKKQQSVPPTPADHSLVSSLVTAG